MSKAENYLLFRQFLTNLLVRSEVNVLRNVGHLFLNQTQKH